MPTFKHGKTAMLWLNGVDVSSYFSTADWSAFAAPAQTSTFQSTWETFIPGMGQSTLGATGYYDSALTNVRAIFVPAPPTLAVLTYLPAGGFAIGDNARLLSSWATDYKEGATIGAAVTMDFSIKATGQAGAGEVLHIMQSEGTGTITGTGAPLGTGSSSTTGAVAHLHVTIPGGVQNFKLQDATTLGGAYTDIAGGAFTAISVAGAQRLVIPGTIRNYVRAVATIITAPCTYAIACART